MNYQAIEIREDVLCELKSLTEMHSGDFLKDLEGLIVDEMRSLYDELSYNTYQNKAYNRLDNLKGFIRISE